MKLYTDRANKNIFSSNKTFILVSIYIILSLKIVSSHKFTYGFIRDQNSGILFFRENKKEILLEAELCDDYELNFYYNIDTIQFNQENCFFRYKKDNFVGFEKLNNILLTNTFQNRPTKGIIECNFDLSYILKLTNDITEIPFNLNCFQFKCILTTLKYLNVVNNKNMVKLLEAVLFNNFINQSNNDLKGKNGNFEEIFSSNFFVNMELTLKKNFLLAFLNVFTIKYIFNGENLILLSKNTEDYNSALFDENIPYKSLMLNNLNIFYIFENILKDSYVLNIFTILLNQINMNSLILDNNLNLKILDLDFKFHIFLAKTFKSITISNFRNSSSILFFSKLSVIFRNDIEYLCLANLQVSSRALVLFLNQKNLKGLSLLHGVFELEHIKFIKENTDPNETLEFIKFQCVILENTWWNYILRKTNIRKIIIFFFTFLEQKDFMAKFIELDTPKFLLHLEINFCYSEIPEDFYHALIYFRSLQTLKLRSYKNDKNTEAFLAKAIENLKDLECFKIVQENIFNFLYYPIFYGHSLKYLHLESLFSDPEIPLLCFGNSYKSLSQLILVNIYISMSSLIEISKLENLTLLSIIFCIFEKNTIDLQKYNFMSKNIYSLELNDINIDIFNYFDIMNEMDYLIYLNLTTCRLFSGYLAKLSSGCNSRLKRLVYESSKLDSNDLARIGNLEVLENLNFAECKFINTNFHVLGNDCKFLNSLRNLNLSFVETTLEDLNYLKKFKNLEELSLTSFPCLNFETIKKYIFPLPISYLSTRINSKRDDFNIICRYFYEKNIIISFI
ncbi:hypothetical protein CWI37_0247p0040 [Hamiltosporidium tvaerminnensis]|uniref:Leucine-rich repeat-containing protein n=1 Tax=Hamiltosporidium tvaerminnensis TaxID=1176355 RepID=A0A4Q9L7S5_9MICR|nr:hypothetical protein CWI37_0247p0040 [Hamiltosporidium tvaerminnensis]